MQHEHKHRGATIPVICITGHGDIPMAVEAMQHGAFDFLQKPFRDQELLDRVQRALARDTEYRTRLRHTDRIRERLATLSPREREVLDLVTQGKANKMVAGDLGVSQRTVEIHRACAPSSSLENLPSVLVKCSMPCVASPTSSGRARSNPHWPRPAPRMRAVSSSQTICAKSRSTNSSRRHANGIATCRFS